MGKRMLILVLPLLAAGSSAWAQGRGGEGTNKAPALFFREEWKSDGKESQMTPANVANPSLELNFYGE